MDTFKGEINMNTINTTSKNTQYVFKTQNTLAEKIISALKNYWEKNSHMILIGLGSMNGSRPFQYYDTHK